MIEENKSGTGNDNKDALRELKELANSEHTQKEVGLGNVKDRMKDKEEENDLINKGEALAVGYKIMPNETFPSKSKYYPSDFEVSFRGLETIEIKHYSSLNEDDLIDVETHLNEVLDKGCKIKFNGGIGSYRDFKEADKLYMLFGIRDRTMEKHQRQVKLMMPSHCNACGETKRVELVNDIFSYYAIDPKLVRYFNPATRAFEFNDELAGKVSFYVPSIGVSECIGNYVKEKRAAQKRGEAGYYNQEFLTYLQFLVEDWRKLNTAYIDKMQKEYDTNWSADKIQFVQTVVEKINLNVKPSMSRICQVEEGGCGAEVTTHIRFPEGYRSIFHLSNINERLFGDTE